MARCQCARCEITFSGVSAFDEHLRDGDRVHVHPSGIARLRQRPDGIWGFPPTEKSAARFIVLNEARRSSQAPGTRAPGP